MLLLLLSITVISYSNELSKLLPDSPSWLWQPHDLNTRKNWPQYCSAGTQTPAILQMLLDLDHSASQLDSGHGSLAVTACISFLHNVLAIKKFKMIWKINQLNICIFNYSDFYKLLLLHISHKTRNCWQLVCCMWNQRRDNSPFSNLHIIWKCCMWGKLENILNNEIDKQFEIVKQRQRIRKQMIDKYEAGH